MVDRRMRFRLAPWAALLVALCLALPLVLGTSQAQSDAQRLDRQTPRGVQDLRDLEAIIAETVARVRPAVVGIRIGGGSGSGCFVSEDGLILSCAHVTNRPGLPCQIVLADGTEIPAVTLGLDPQQDYALVQAQTDGRPMPFAEVGDSDAIAAGQWTIAMGHPLGPEQGRGPVVRVGRILNIGRKIFHDGPLISGDSGGPLFDLRGRIVGINVSIDASNPSSNHATPVNLARDHWQEMLDSEVIGGGQGTEGRTFENAITNAYSVLDEERYADAEAAFREAIAMDPTRGDGYYHLSCCYIRWALSLPEDSEERAERMDQVFDALAEAVTNGWTNLEHMEQDTDMEAIRDDRRYFLIVTAIHRNLGNAPYLGINARAISAERADELGISGGMEITIVREGHAGHHAGLAVGDVIARVEGEVTPSSAVLGRILRTSQPGDTLDFIIQSEPNEGHVVEVVLGGRGAGNIAQGALPPAERRGGAQMLSAFNAIVGDVPQSVCIMRNERGRMLGFGTVVRADGLVIAKASEVNGDGIVAQMTGRDEAFPAERVATNEALDLSVFRLEGATDLTPAPWDPEISQSPELGRFLAIVGTGRSPHAIGTVAIDRYENRRPQDIPFLGVGGGFPVASFEMMSLGIEGGIRVTRVERHSGSHRSGMRPGDIIYRVEGEVIRSMQDLVRIVTQHQIGDTLDFLIIRNTLREEMRITLGRRPAISGSNFGLQGRMDTILGPRNERGNGFGVVIQTDAIIRPNETGSPVVDLQGRVIGWLVSRTDRIRCYIVPAHELLAVLAPILETIPPPGQDAPEDPGEEDDDGEEGF